MSYIYLNFYTTKFPSHLANRELELQSDPIMKNLPKFFEQFCNQWPILAYALIDNFKRIWGISKVVLAVIVHQSHCGQEQGFAAFNAPIINQRQRCCQRVYYALCCRVHDMMLNNRIQQLVSLFCMTDIFLYYVIGQYMNAQRYLTNQNQYPKSAPSPSDREF